jgi:hypothetical protein
MRSKNSMPFTAEESAYLAEVKLCPCVICDAPAPSDAHHVEQGLHFIACSLCKDCHTGPHGWHGDKSRWRAAKMTEMRAINETRRRVDLLRAGRAMPTQVVPRMRRQSAKPTADGAIPRYVARPWVKA